MVYKKCYSLLLNQPFWFQLQTYRHLKLQLIYVFRDDYIKFNEFSQLDSNSGRYTGMYD